MHHAQEAAGALDFRFDGRRNGKVGSAFSEVPLNEKKLFTSSIIFIMTEPKLTHVDEAGNAHMVDVGHKPETERMAVARGEVQMKLETLQLIRAGALKKGDVLTVAQVAGITGGKRTADLIPFCHPLSLNHLEVSFELDDALPGVYITATARTSGKTGVEMEAFDRGFNCRPDNLRYGKSCRENHADQQYPAGGKTRRTKWRHYQ